MSIQADPISTGNRIIEGIAASELMGMSFPEPKWAIPGILIEGVNVFAGKPKKGKSILALNVCLDIASGNKVLGRIHAEQGTVLYFALEDSMRRLQDRLGMMTQGTNTPKELRLYNDLPRSALSRFDILKRAIERFPDVRLVVIDTLAMFTGESGISKEYSYKEDYQKIVNFKEIGDKYHVSILLIHHLRKQESDDVMDTFLGTQGLTGAADGLLALVDGKGQSNRDLIIKGRDVEESTYTLKFNREYLRWSIIETASNTMSTPMQQTLYDVMKKSAIPITPKSISEMTGLREQYVKNTLPKLIAEGKIRKVNRGQYECVDNK